MKIQKQKPITFKQHTLTNLNILEKNTVRVQNSSQKLKWHYAQLRGNNMCKVES